MNISKHFTLAECLATSHATPAEQRKFFTVEDAIRASLLAHTVLEPLRKALGVPIKINSWFRSPPVNAATKGSKTSQHADAGAADIVPACNLWAAYEWLDCCDIGQRIMYLDASGKPSRIHVSIPRTGITANNRSLVKLHTGKLTPFHAAMAQG